MEQVKDWLDSWCNLWPENVEFGGYKIKSKPKECLRKMEKFCKDNPKFTKDIIFKATTNYLEEKAFKDWAYIKQSTYFISKQGQPSLLENYCEKLVLYDTVPKERIGEITGDEYAPINDFI